MIGRFTFFGLLTLYPFVVYFGLRILPASFFAILLAVVVLLRTALLRADERASALPVLLILLAYACTAAFIGRTEALLFYPVLVNALLCATFTMSLWHGTPLLLRIVRARGIPISEHGPRYLARLTGVWAAFFALNGLVALWTTTRTLESWTLYNGLISYVAVGVLIVCEWLYRKRYKRLRGVSEA